jgi:hypothetical protein
MDTLRQDLVYAVRRLWQAPGFALVAIATLALGIGANSAIFSVVDAVLLRPLPFAEPERLVQLAQVWEGRSTGVYSPQNFLDVVAQAPSFASLAAIDNDGLTMTGRGEPLRLQGARVSVTFFDLLDVRPAHGRAFADGENEPGRSRVVILGHRLWTQRFGGDPAVLGQTVQLNREPYVVIGVAPADFAYPEGTEAWIPLEYDAIFRGRSRGAWYLSVIGRLKPGISVEHARQGGRCVVRSWFSSAPSASSCSSPASTWPTSSSRASPPGTPSSPCEPRWALAADACCASS